MCSVNSKMSRKDLETKLREVKIGGSIEFKHAGSYRYYIKRVREDGFLLSDGYWDGRPMTLVELLDHLPVLMFR